MRVKPDRIFFARPNSRSLKTADAQGAKNPSNHARNVFSGSACFNGKKHKERITCLASPLSVCRCQASLGGKMVQR